MNVSSSDADSRGSLHACSIYRSREQLARGAAERVTMPYDRIDSALDQIQFRMPDPETEWHAPRAYNVEPKPLTAEQQERSTAAFIESYRHGDFAPPDVSAMPVYGGQAETPAEQAPTPPPRVAHDDPGY